MSFDPPAGTRRFSHAWLVVALLWPVALLNYLDRQLVATMKKSIMADIPSIATDENYGRLMAIFLWIYAVLSPVGGFCADRFNRRWTVIVSLGVWSLVTWLTGQARTFDQMWWARAAMGVSEACYMPAALALIASFHTGPTRSRAIGIHQTGIYAGLALGGIGGVIADSSFGWRAGFKWFGFAGVAFAIVLLFALPSAAPPDDERGEKKNAVSAGAALGSLLGAGAFILLVLYFTLPAMPGWVMKNWLPSVLADKFHLAQGKAGFSATLYVTLASLVGALLGGTLADRWMHYTSRGRIYLSAIGTALCIPALFGVGCAPTLGVAIVFLILYGIGWGFFDANNMPILCQIARPEYRATGYGLMNLVSVSGGAWVTVKLGALRDQGTPPSTIFTMCALAAAVSVVLVLLIHPKPQNPDLSC
ncbi:MAG TPA: MFS transporter [Chthoniobacteraceae bacterium]|nr:MFS transporter [Chthoniobacteraceae bacterium]